MKENNLQLFKKSAALIPSGVHQNYHSKPDRPPTYFIRGDKSRLFDVDNKEYLDLYANAGAMFLGHNHPVYNKKLIQSIQKITAVHNTKFDLYAAEYMTKYIPCCEMVRFCLSGTQAVQNALRLSRAYTGKNKFIRFMGHFHGNADNVLGGSIPSESGHIPQQSTENVFYSEGVVPGIQKSQSYLLPWNNIDILNNFLNEHHDIAAIIMEPINLNGGGILPQNNYLKKVRNICNRYGILLIFDEIVTGIRIGLGGAQEHYCVTPDIALFGKCIGGGSLPLSAVAASREIMKLYEKNRVIFGGTFNGYTLSLAALIAVFEILEANKEEIYNSMHYYSKKIRQILLNAAMSEGVALTIQGPDACLSYHCRNHELESNCELNQELLIKNGVIRDCLYKQGILVANTSRLYFNISINKSDVKFVEQRADKVFRHSKTVIDRLMNLNWKRRKV